MDSLLSDIASKQAEYSDIDTFVKSNNLKKHDINIFTEENLPANFYMGKFYLIKNKGIIEIETGPEYHTIDIRFMFTGEMIWKSVVVFHNVSSAELNGADTSEDMISHDMDATAKFVLALMKSKFILYSRLS